MKILVADNLCKCYGKNENKIRAVNNVSLEVMEGALVAIMGPSGSGKSTLLNLLAGLDKPDSGKVYINGVDIYKLKDNELTKFRRKNIGFVYQFYNLVPVLTVKENILLPALLDNKKYDKKYFYSLIKTLGLSDRLNHLPNEISGGQQQRASIGRSLINKPKILFADEPTGNLDSKNTYEIMNLLKASAKENDQTLVVITHDPEIVSYADRNIVMKDGKIDREEKVVWWIS